MGIHLEKNWGGFTLRTCHTVGEFRQVVALQKEIWQFDDIDLVPSRLLVVGEKIGGHVLGAYDGSLLVAFAYGLVGMREDQTYIHSHMLGVKSTHRNTGIGRELKLLQREIALQQSCALIEWTFDPLEIKNAYFNLEKLGAIVRRYVVNQYGITSSPLQGGLPSDRLIAEWWLTSERVLETLQSGKRPQIEVRRTVKVPAEIYEWKSNQETRSRAAEVQRQIRDLLQSCFADGLSIIGYERSARGDGCFLLGEFSPASE